MSDTDQAAVEALRCPSCGASINEQDTFCESCGAGLGADGAAAPGDGPAADPSSEVTGPAGSDLSDPMAALDNTRTHLAFVDPADAEDAPFFDPQPHEQHGSPCPACGGEIAADGYCTMCGARAASERDHWDERPTDWVGGVCDRGVRHPRNEDAMALAATGDVGSAAVLVVCDGVSSAPNSDIASKTAAETARDALEHGFTAAPGPVSARLTYWTEQIEQAADLAHLEVLDATRATTDGSIEALTNPPSCTFVCCVVHGPVMVTGWVGDSRAYWLPDSGPAVQLTIDDSWATDQIALGMPRAVAEQDSRAHSITRWLGADSTDWTPRCAVATPDGGGWLLLCSDGLWNYVSDASDLRDLLDTVVPRDDPLGRHPADAAADLVSWACAQGGHDNVTVALARVPSSGPHPTEAGTSGTGTDGGDGGEGTADHPHAEDRTARTPVPAGRAPADGPPDPTGEPLAAPDTAEGAQDG